MHKRELNFKHEDGTTSRVVLENRGDVLLAIQRPNKHYKHWGAGVFKEEKKRDVIEYDILDIDNTEYQSEEAARASGEAMLAARLWERSVSH